MRNLVPFQHVCVVMYGFRGALARVELQRVEDRNSPRGLDLDLLAYLL